MELAEKANISIPFLSNIERNNKWPYPDTLVKLAKALDVDVHTLFLEIKPPKQGCVQDILAQFKNDMAVSLHKTISASIDNSLETISAHYIEESQNNQ